MIWWKESDIQIDLDETDPVRNITKTLISIATDDTALLVLCRCFEVGHPKALTSAKKQAKVNGHDFEDSEYAPADLFSLEELATAIIPLFIRLAKRTNQAIQSLIR